MFFSRKKRVRSPPSSSDEESDAWEKEKQPQLFNFYEDDILNPNEVDHLLRDEMMQLSVRDRNKIFEEIHGVRCMAPDETPKFLERALLEIDSELAKIPIANKKAFLAATASRKNNSNQNNVCNNKNHDKNERKHGDCCGVCSVNFVDSAEFRLRFLRCELFDAKKAAQRLVNYLELITTMMPFKRGSELLKRPITLADFDEVEQSILRKGHLQLLPFRDRSGRRVLAGVASLGIRFDPLQWVSSVRCGVLLRCEVLLACCSAECLCAFCYCVCFCLYLCTHAARDWLLSCAVGCIVKLWFSINLSTRTNCHFLNVSQ